MSRPFIILLRAVNVGGRKLVMADLRAAAIARGLTDFRTYIQSGNLACTHDGTEAEVEAAIEALIAEEFSLDAIAIARTAEAFAAIVATNPFPEADPKRLHLCLTKRPPRAETAEALAARALAGERIALASGAVWIDFAGDVGDSKLTPGSLDRAAGSTLTARNMNTVTKLIEMSRG